MKKKKKRKEMKMKRKWMREIRWPWRVKTLDRLHDPKGSRIFANDDRYATGTRGVPQSTSQSSLDGTF